MKEKSEVEVSQIVRDFFLGEFAFDELQYTPINLKNGNTKELADVVINYGNNIIAIQIKERKAYSNSKDEEKWINKHISKAKDQLVDTYNQLNNNVIPAFVNGKGDSYKINKYGLYTGIIILYNDKIDKYKRVLSCSRLNGIVHCFSYSDFVNCCKKLILPRDIMEYIEYRERKVKIDRISNEKEKCLVDSFLVEKYGICKFKDDELDIFRWFLKNYKDRLVEGNKGEYRKIIDVFLELDRAGVNAFSQRLSKIIGFAKDKKNSNNSFIVPSNRNMTSFLFLSADSGDRIIEYIYRMTYLFMYKTKSSKCLTVVAYFDSENEYRLDWGYVESPWKYDKVFEEVCNLPEFRRLWNPQLIVEGKIETR